MAFILAPFCKDLLSVAKVSKAFKTANKELTNKIVSCFFSCYKNLFVKWSVITYNQYHSKFIEEIAENAFTDGILKFSTFATENYLYEEANLKTILFSFYKNKLKETLQNQKRFDEKEKKLANTFSNLVSLNLDENNKEHLLVILEKAISEMEPEDKKIVKWRHFELKSNEEIANMLGITVASATNRIYRCMQRLRQIMQKINTANELN